MFKKPALALAGLALVAGSTAACGGGSGSSGSPDSASVADFCGAFNYGLEQMMSGGTDLQKDTSKELDLIHTWADKMKSTGTPKGISSDARAGFELVVDKLGKVTSKDLSGSTPLNSLDQGLSATQQKQGQAFGTYEQSTCQAYPPKGMPSLAVPSAS